MKICIKYLFLFLFFCSGGSLLAQISIFDAMAVHEPGKGTVTIHQSAAIRSLVGRQSFDSKIETVGDKSYLVMQGYRIEVFSGNNQRTSMAEAQDKENQIKNRFSDIQTYVTLSAPFWRLRVGDYITYEEAFSMMSKLGEAFPAFKREIQLVKEEVRIPMN